MRMVEKGVLSIAIIVYSKHVYRPILDPFVKIEENIERCSVQHKPPSSMVERMPKHCKHFHDQTNVMRVY